MRLGAPLFALGLTAASAGMARPAEDGVRFGMLGWGQVALSGDADTAVAPGGRLEVDGPLAVAHHAAGRIYVRLDLTAAPGSSALDFARPETFGRSAELTLGAYRSVGRLSIGAQEIRTSLAWEWGFSTALDGQLQPRYLRHYCGGIRLEELAAGAGLAVMYGRHEAGGARGYGQLLIAGQVPLAGVKAVVFGGDAVLSVGPRRLARDQRDVLRLWVALDLPGLVGMIRR